MGWLVYIRTNTVAIDFAPFRLTEINRVYLTFSPRACWAWSWSEPFVLDQTNLRAQGSSNAPMYDSRRKLLIRDLCQRQQAERHWSDISNAFNQEFAIWHRGQEYSRSIVGLDAEFQKRWPSCKQYANCQGCVHLVQICDDFFRVQWFCNSSPNWWAYGDGDMYPFIFLGETQ